MAKSVSAAKAKAQFSALVAEAAFGGKRVVIERRGKPVAALVSMEDLERLEQGQPTSARPLGALALAGAWREAGDTAINAVVREIYMRREQDAGRRKEIEY